MTLSGCHRRSGSVCHALERFRFGVVTSSAYPTNWEDYKDDAIAHLLTAYCQTGQWQTAEKFLFAQLDSFWRVLPKALAEIALAAAQANAVDDAMRLWRMSAKH